ncbi:MAG TPA: hypothetical protein VJN90_08880, partial [Candidatus Acidoferrales bacterium]|nr:hypothetical protein [Candidatus Acidoferrales bacterium]
DTVLVHRLGDFICPVDVEVKFDSGEIAHEHWDGKDRWIRYSYTKPAKIVWAQIDPQYGIWMDRDFYNNSKTAEPDTRATRKLSNIWLFVSEWLGQALSWLT